MWCSRRHYQSSAHAPGHTGPAEGPGLEQKSSRTMHRQSSGKVPCTTMGFGSTAKVLQCLLLMTQVEFAQGTAESTATVQNLGKSLDMCSKRCITSKVLVTALQNLKVDTHLHKMPHVRRQDCGKRCGCQQVLSQEVGGGIQRQQQQGCPAPCRGFHPLEECICRHRGSCYCAHSLSQDTQSLSLQLLHLGCNEAAGIGARWALSHGSTRVFAKCKPNCYGFSWAITSTCWYACKYFTVGLLMHPCQTLGLSGPSRCLILYVVMGMGHPLSAQGRQGLRIDYQRACAEPRKEAEHTACILTAGQALH